MVSTGSLKLEERLRSPSDIDNPSENNLFALNMVSKLRNAFGNNRYRVVVSLPYELIVSPRDVRTKRPKPHILDLTLLEVDARDTSPVYVLIEPIIRQDPNSSHYFRMFLRQRKNKVY